jgi:hypothetical protein
MMHRAKSNEVKADSLLDLLIGQCADLEALLALAREEEAAAEARNFDEILRVTQERATIGERLETYHRQIAEMRMRLGEAAEPALRCAQATRAATLVMGILEHDGRSRPLLLAARQEIAGECLRLDQTRRGMSAYLQENSKTPVACDQQA